MRCFLRIMGVLLGLLCFTATPALATEYRDVSSVGTGVTLKDALMDAFTDAIGQVNGVSVESKQELASVEVSLSNSNNDAYLSSESFRNSVKAATKGVIAQYSVVSRQRAGASGRWAVALNCKVVVYRRPEIADRRRIAVMPMRLSAKEFFIEGRAVDREAVRGIFGQGILSALVQSRRFTVLDRDYLSEILRERQMIVDGNTPVEQMVRLGQELAADYIVVGAFEDIGFETRTDTMQLSGRALTSRNGRVEVSYRVIDIDTKQVVYSDFARIAIGESEMRKLGLSAGSDGIESALCKVAADRIGKQILNAIYPILVVSASSGEVTLGQGGSGLHEGDRFDLYEYGERLVDPYNKEVLGRSETYVGTVEVVRVNPKQSLAKILHAEKDIAASFQPKKFVCREVNIDAGTLLKQQRDARDTERRKSFDKDW